MHFIQLSVTIFAWMQGQFYACKKACAKSALIRIFLLKGFLCGMKRKLIELKNICKAYDGEQVLSNIDLYINDHEFITLLVPSGCGKTTTLRIIGGFEYPDEGDVYFDGQRINDVPAHKRNVNTVFQKYALFPHLNVYDNIAFGLTIAKVNKNEIRKVIPYSNELA